MVRLTFSIDYDFRVIAIRSHEHCFIIYLLFCQTGLSINDFQKLFPTISYCQWIVSRVICVGPTVFVIPSVNLTNSILLSPWPQSGFKARTSLKAEDWESAELYDNGMYLGDACGLSWPLQVEFIMGEGRAVREEFNWWRDSKITVYQSIYADKHELVIIVLIEERGWSKVCRRNSHPGWGTEDRFVECPPTSFWIEGSLSKASCSTHIERESMEYGSIV